MRPQLLFRKIHKWVGLIIGVQILFWFLSGFLMSFMPIEEIHGDHLFANKTSAAVSLDQIDLTKLTDLVESPVLSVAIEPWLGQTVLAVTTQEETILFDASSLKQISPVSENQVKAVLAKQLADGLEIESIRRLTETPPEARGRSAPLWQVQLNGSENARIYISEQTGRVVATRTDRWRLFDFMWMLHIMDYDERTDFNHPLLYLTALSALLFTLTGFVLLFYSFKRNKT